MAVQLVCDHCEAAVDHLYEVRALGTSRGSSETNRSDYPRGQVCWDCLPEWKRLQDKADKEVPF